MYISAGINGEEFYNLLLENEQFQKNFSIAKANEVKELFGTFQKICNGTDKLHNGHMLPLS